MVRHRIAKVIVIISAVAVLSSTPIGGHAQAKNLVRDCYVHSDIGQPSSAPEAELFVFIDETTVLDNSLKQQAIDRATEFLKENRRFTVGRFSAFVQGHYADLVSDGYMQPDLTSGQRNGLPRPKVKDFDTCRLAQTMEARQGIGYTMLDIMNGATNDIVRSDIMTSLKTFSASVAASSATRKVVFVVSDMLENSSIASFYEKNGLGRVGDDVLRNAEKADAFGDFAGADVYVLGAATFALTDKAAAKSYHEPQRLERLEKFWRDWFARSKAHVVFFGEPTLTINIR